MKVALQFVIWFIIGLISLFLAILLGQRGSWYLAWVLGTAMIVLIAVAGTILLDAQDAGAEAAQGATEQQQSGIR